MIPLRVVFAGTPDFACPSLRALSKAGHRLLLVICQPDRPRGRGMRLASPAVKLEADHIGLPLAQPELIDTPDFRRTLEALAPDFVAVVAFGQKIPSWLLSLPPLGCLNVHASLLPRYRGAAPIQRAIMNGDEETGVTIMRLDEGWDTGPLLTQGRVRIGPHEDAGSLHDRLASVGARLLVETVARLAAGEIVPVPQDDAAATRAPKIRPEEERLDWTRPTTALYNLVRALAPGPLAETSHGSKRLQIRETRPAEPAGDSPPGTVQAVNGGGILVRTGDGALLLTRVKPAGGRLMSAADYARGHGLAPGDRLG